MLTANFNDLTMGMRCIKWMIFTINLMMTLTGALLILVGLAINAVYDDFSHFMYDRFSAPPSMLVAIGVIILLVSLFGCIGAIKESTAWINVYGVLLLVIFALQVTAAISAFSMQNQIDGMLVRSMYGALNDYNKDEVSRDGVDFLQQNLECCGIEGPSDWEGILSPPSQGSPETIIVPASCCAHFSNETLTCEHRYTNGCLPGLRFLVQQGTSLVVTGALAVAMVQILAVICAFMLAKTIRQTKSLREARRWQIQQTFAIITDPQVNDYEASLKTEEKAERLFAP